MDVLGRELSRAAEARRVADVLAIAIAVGTFAFLFWAIDLIDRI